MKVSPIITKSTSIPQHIIKPISSCDDHLNEETKKNIPFETIHNEQNNSISKIENPIMLENELVQANISIITDFNNMNYPETTNNRINNLKEVNFNENFKSIDENGDSFYNIPSSVIFEKTKYNEAARFESLKKIKKTEKCIKRIIFFLLLIFFCSVLYLLLRDVISFE